MKDGMCFNLFFGYYVDKGANLEKLQKLTDEMCKNESLAIIKDFSEEFKDSAFKTETLKRLSLDFNADKKYYSKRFYHSFYNELKNFENKEIIK